MYNEVPFSVLVGQTIIRAEGLKTGSDEVLFYTDKGRYKMYHQQDCCENVQIEDLDGDASNIEGGVVISAEEISGETPSDYTFNYEPESYTWTFYKLETTKGGIFVRWLGESNGYYGEEVSFEELE